MNNFFRVKERNNKEDIDGKDGILIKEKIWRRRPKGKKILEKGGFWGKKGGGGGSLKLLFAKDGKTAS